jgi:hypothetical protein
MKNQLSPVCRTYGQERLTLSVKQIFFKNNLEITNKSRIFAP